MIAKLNKNKNIGQVLYIVEGSHTESFLLWKVFSKIFDYQVEAVLRDHPYRVYNKKDHPHSKIFVINAEESNIKYISKDNEFLNNLFKVLIEDYDFNVDKATIYYLFDRDPKSNTDPHFINLLLNTFTNAHENDNYYRGGLLLLSYPSIESFTLSCLQNNSFSVKFGLGDDLKRYLNEQKMNQSNIDEAGLELATKNLLDALLYINEGSLFDIDNFKEVNIKTFSFEEAAYFEESLYHCLSMLAISLIDLGLIEIEL